MTKSNKKVKKNSSNNRQIIGVLVGIIVLSLGAFFILSNNTGNTEVVSNQPQMITPEDYNSTYLANNTDHILLDVRTPEEFASGYIAGAINIPVQELDQRLSELSTDKEIIVYCRSGNRSAQASTILSNNGFSSVADMGGIIDWEQAGYPVES